MSSIMIDPERCKRCGNCVRECPETVFEQRDAASAPEVLREHLCIACGHCVALCRSDAVAHAEFPPRTLHPITLELMPGPANLMELLRARRSARAFKDTPVERSLLEKVIEAARLAPTAHNYQGTQYIVVQDRQVLKQAADMTAAFLGKTARLLRNPAIRTLYGLVAKHELKSAMGMLENFEHLEAAAKQGGDKVLRGAPCLLLFHADPGLAYPDKSAQLAVQNAALLCVTLGLSSFYTGYLVGGCEHLRQLRRLLGVPAGHRVYAGLAIGYPKFTFHQWPDRKPAEVLWRQE